MQEESNLKKGITKANLHNIDKIRLLIFVVVLGLVILGIGFLFNNNTINVGEEQTILKEPVDITNDFKNGDKIALTNKALEPSISLVIADLGLDKKIHGLIYNLPKEIALGFSPYADNVSGLIDTADKKGYDTLIHLPMQSLDYPSTDLGSYCLLDSFSDIDNTSRINSILSKSHKVKGVYINPDEVFTNSRSRLRLCLEEINNKAVSDDEFLYIYQDIDMVKRVNVYSNDLGLQRMRPESIGVIIDSEVDAKDLRRQFLDAENIAKSRGGVLVVVYPSLDYFDRLSTWISSLSDKGIKLVRVGDIHKYMRDHDHKKEIDAFIHADRSKKSDD